MSVKIRFKQLIAGNCTVQVFQSYDGEYYSTVI